MSRPLIIDSFAGGGGASTGIERALGRGPDIAINHDAAALAMHAANHPDTHHITSDIWGVEPLEVTKGRHVELLWASPDCKHFSKAKGRAPKDRTIRDLAWVVVRWAEEVKPNVILLENVEEFQSWSPVGEDGQPVKGMEGVTFDLWRRRLRKAGYRVQFRELRACDYGAPTIRKRLFMVARRDGRPIVWPKPSHGDPRSAAVRKGRLKPWRTAADCIDWTRPCPSIFETKAAIKRRYGLDVRRPLVPNTMARIARGMKRYVLDAQEPFLVNLSHGGQMEPGPAPLRTITGENRGEKAAVAPYLSHLYGSNEAGGGGCPHAPLKTVTSGGLHHAIIAPTLVQTGYGERPGQAPRALDMFAPLGTVVAGGAKHAAVSASLTPWITYGQQGGANRDPAGPLRTVTAGSKDSNGVAAVYLAQQNNDARRIGGVNPGRAATAPVSTLTGTGSHQTPVTAFLAKYYGTTQDPRLDGPIHTATTKARFGHVQASLGVPPFTGEMRARARQVAAFLRAHDAWDDREFVTLEVGGGSYVVVDIGMRMLAPRELYTAQGFPADYVIEGSWTERDGTWTFHPFAQGVQIKCVGNSVCPDVAEALVSANVGYMALEQAA